ncbi:hypothetical protein COLO4_32552 [Corchorus olitorius]|uniref:Uncharacterized protein n=1 Tax=Corchorus olitorius TaxID=93759 RepID=A0A1R3GZA1_9ROSI|nr:hypothetical protein COLO4_32552 [Corchorus olitorius]
MSKVLFVSALLCIAVAGVLAPLASPPAAVPAPAPSKTKVKSPSPSPLSSPPAPPTEAPAPTLGASSPGPAGTDVSGVEKMLPVGKMVGSLVFGWAILSLV